MGTYASEAQMRWAHTKAGMMAMGPQEVATRDKASKGKKLPAKVVKRINGSRQGQGRG